MTQRDTIFQIAKNNYGVVSVREAYKHGVTLNSIKKLAHDNDDFINVARGVYIWYDENIDMDAYDKDGYSLGNLYDYKVALEVAGDNSILYGISVLEMLNLGDILASKQYVGKFNNRRRNANDGIEYVDLSNRKVKIQKYYSIPSQSAYEALLENKNMYSEDDYIRALSKAYNDNLISKYEWSKLGRL
jgi:hypothetical protein